MSDQTTSTAKESMALKGEKEGFEPKPLRPRRKIHNLDYSEFTSAYIPPYEESPVDKCEEDINVADMDNARSSSSLALQPTSKSDGSISQRAETLRQNAIAAAAAVKESLLNADQHHLGQLSPTDEKRRQNRLQLRETLIQLLKLLPETDNLSTINVVALAASRESDIWHNTDHETDDTFEYETKVVEELEDLQIWDAHWDSDEADDGSDRTGCEIFREYIHNCLKKDQNILSKSAAASHESIAISQRLKASEEEPERTNARMQLETAIGDLINRYSDDNEMSAVDVPKVAASWESVIYTDFEMSKSAGEYLEKVRVACLELNAYIDNWDEPCYEGQTGKEAFCQFFHMYLGSRYLNSTSISRSIDDELYELAGGNDYQDSDDQEHDSDTDSEISPIVSKAKSVVDCEVSLEDRSNLRATTTSPTPSQFNFNSNSVVSSIDSKPYEYSTGHHSFGAVLPSPRQLPQLIRDRSAQDPGQMQAHPSTEIFKSATSIFQEHQDAYLTACSENSCPDYFQPPDSLSPCDTSRPAQPNDDMDIGDFANIVKHIDKSTDSKTSKVNQSEFRTAVPTTKANFGEYGDIEMLGESSDQGLIELTVNTIMEPDQTHFVPIDAEITMEKPFLDTGEITGYLGGNNEALHWNNSMPPWDAQLSFPSAKIQDVPSFPQMSLITDPFTGLPIFSFATNEPQAPLSDKMPGQQATDATPQHLTFRAEELNSMTAFPVQQSVEEIQAAQLVNEMMVEVSPMDIGDISAPTPFPIDTVEMSTDVEMSESPYAKGIPNPRASIFNISGLDFGRPLETHNTPFQSLTKVDFGVDTANLDGLKHVSSKPRMVIGDIETITNHDQEVVAFNTPIEGINTFDGDCEAPKASSDDDYGDDGHRIEELSILSEKMLGPTQPLSEASKSPEIHMFASNHGNISGDASSDVVSHNCEISLHETNVPHMHGNSEFTEVLQPSAILSSDESPEFHGSNKDDDHTVEESNPINTGSAQVDQKAHLPVQNPVQAVEHGAVVRNLNPDHHVLRFESDSIVVGRSDDVTDSCPAHVPDLSPDAAHVEKINIGNREGQDEISLSPKPSPIDMETIMKHVSKLHQNLIMRVNKIDAKLDHIHTYALETQRNEVVSTLTNIKEDITTFAHLSAQELKEMVKELPAEIKNTSDEQTFDDVGIDSLLDLPIEEAKGVKEKSGKGETEDEDEEKEDDEIEKAFSQRNQDPTLADQVTDEHDLGLPKASEEELKPNERFEYKASSEDQRGVPVDQGTAAISTEIILEQKENKTPTSPIIHQQAQEVQKLSLHILAYQTEWKLASSQGGIPRTLIDGAEALFEAYRTVDKKDDFLTAKKLIQLGHQWEALRKAAIAFLHLSSAFSNETQCSIQRSAKNLREHANWQQAYLKRAMQDRSVGKESLAKRWECLAADRTQAYQELQADAKTKLDVLIELYQVYHSALQDLCSRFAFREISKPLGLLASITLADYHERIMEIHAAFNIPFGGLARDISDGEL